MHSSISPPKNHRTQFGSVLLKATAKVAGPTIVISANGQMRCIGNWSFGCPDCCFIPSTLPSDALDRMNNGVFKPRSEIYYTYQVYAVGRVPPMSIGHTLLGLLECRPCHGYDLKRAYDEQFGHDRPLHYGQVYSTLARLLRNGLVVEAGTEQSAGPARKSYAITDAGITDVERWLSTPESADPYLRNILYTKVVLALLSGRSAQDVLEVQRRSHRNAIRALTARKRDNGLVDGLICDHALLHLEADLRWLELAATRIDELADRVR